MGWRGGSGKGAIHPLLRNLCRGETTSLEGYRSDDEEISQPLRGCHGYWGENGGGRG